MTPEREEWMERHQGKTLKQAVDAEIFALLESLDPDLLNEIGYTLNEINEVELDCAWMLVDGWSTRVYRTADVTAHYGAGVVNKCGDSARVHRFGCFWINAEMCDDIVQKISSF